MLLEEHVGVGPSRTETVLRVRFSRTGQRARLSSKTRPHQLRPWPGAFRPSLVLLSADVEPTFEQQSWQWPPFEAGTTMPAPQSENALLGAA